MTRFNLGGCNKHFLPFLLKIYEVPQVIQQSFSQYSSACLRAEIFGHEWFRVTDVLVFYVLYFYFVLQVEDINNIMGQEMGFPEASLAFRSKYKVM